MPWTYRPYRQRPSRRSTLLFGLAIACIVLTAGQSRRDGPSQAAGTLSDSMAAAEGLETWRAKAALHYGNLPSKSTFGDETLGRTAAVRNAGWSQASGVFRRSAEDWSEKRQRQSLWQSERQRMRPIPPRWWFVATAAALVAGGGCRLWERRCLGFAASQRGEHEPSGTAVASRTLCNDAIPATWFIQRRRPPEIVLWFGKTMVVGVAIGVVAIGLWWPWVATLAARIRTEML